jgi:hypothetical protein
MLRAIMSAGLVVFASCMAFAQTAENSPAFEGLLSQKCN